MPRFKPRIVVTIVTEDSSWEFSTVKGRECADGTPSAGPTKQQIKIASKAIAALCAAESTK